MNMTYSGLITVLAALFLGMTACNTAAVTSDLSALATQVDQDKVLVEGLVHDLKAPETKSISITPQLQNVQEEYEDARAAQQAYFSTVDLAVQANNRRVDLNPRARDVENAADRFIRTAASILEQRERGLKTTAQPLLSDSTGMMSPTGHVIKCSGQVHAAIMQMPKAFRSTATNDFKTRSRWRSWDEL